MQTATVRIHEHGVTPPLEIHDRYATVQTSLVTGGADVLGVVGPAFTVIQHEAHADLLSNTLVDESGAHFETAGSLRGGRGVFLLMKLSTHPRDGLAHLMLAVMAAGLTPAALNDLTH